MNNALTATEVLRIATSIAQADLIGEAAQGMEHGEEFARRAWAAVDKGFAIITEEGLYVLTAQGEAFLAR